MALGAERGAVIRMVLAQGARLAAFGCVAGLVATFALTRFMRELLYRVSVTDPPTMTGSAVALVAVAILATYLPARRAASVDPTVALRQE